MKIEQGLNPHGVFTLKHFRDGKLIHEEQTDNIVVTEGKDYIAAVSYEGFAQKSNFYLAMFGENLSPQADDTASGTNAVHPDVVGTAVATRLGELGDAELIETARQVWTGDAANNGASSSNSDAPAVYTMQADDTIYGAYMISSSTQGGEGATDILLAAANFGTPRAVFATDLIQLVYEIQLT